MKKIKSLIFTLMVCGGVLGGLYFIPVEIASKDKKESKYPVVSEEEQLLGEGELLVQDDKVEIISTELVSDTDVKKQIEEEKVVKPIEPEKHIEKKEEQKEIVVKEELKNEKIEISKNLIEKKEDKKKLTQSKEVPKKQLQPKESKIGIDRKLISGVPGTLNYKGKFPSHNVKEKGTITISYKVDANGNVISAHRVDGLRDRNTINNAISMIRKYVKAEKSKSSSIGTYTITFK